MSNQNMAKKGHRCRGRREIVSCFVTEQRGVRDGVWGISGASGAGVAHCHGPLDRGCRGSRQRCMSALMERG